MTTLLITHPASLNHLNGTGHPERPDRIREIENVLEQEKFQTLLRNQAPRPELEIAPLSHPIDYILEIKSAVPSEGLVQLDADTSMSPGSFEAALRAIGGTRGRATRSGARKPATPSSRPGPPGIMP